MQPASFAPDPIRDRAKFPPPQTFSRTHFARLSVAPIVLRSRPRGSDIHLSMLRANCLKGQDAE